MDSKAANTLNDEYLLLQQASTGSRIAFSTLYSFYIPKLYKYVFPFVRFSKEETEEILHDIFMKIWERKEELSKIKSFNSYLYSMARNKLVNLHEHGKVKQKAIDYITCHANAATESADHNYIYNQYNEVFRNAVNALPPKRRSVFEMSTYEGLTQDEIARELSISKSMVKKQLYIATRYVKEYLRVHADLMAFLAICLSVKFFR